MGEGRGRRCTAGTGGGGLEAAAESANGSPRAQSGLSPAFVHNILLEQSSHGAHARSPLAASTSGGSMAQCDRDGRAWKARNTPCGRSAEEVCRPRPRAAAEEEGTAVCREPIIPPASQPPPPPTGQRPRVPEVSVLAPASRDRRRRVTGQVKVSERPLPETCSQDLRDARLPAGPCPPRAVPETRLRLRGLRLGSLCLPLTASALRGLIRQEVTSCWSLVLLPVCLSVQARGHCRGRFHPELPRAGPPQPRDATTPVLFSCNVQSPAAPLEPVGE